MSAAYKVARRLALARDGGRCVVCHKGDDLTTHHRIPRYAGGDHSPHNLTTLCRPCHTLIEELDALPLYLSWQPYL